MLRRSIGRLASLSIPWMAEGHLPWLSPLAGMNLGLMRILWPPLWSRRWEDRPLISRSHILLIRYLVSLFHARLLAFILWTLDHTLALNSNVIFICGEMGVQIGYMNSKFGRKSVMLSGSWSVHLNVGQPWAFLQCTIPHQSQPLNPGLLFRKGYLLLRFNNMMHAKGKDIMLWQNVLRTL